MLLIVSFVLILSVMGNGHRLNTPQIQVIANRTGAKIDLFPKNGDGGDYTFTVEFNKDSGNPSTCHQHQSDDDVDNAEFCLIWSDNSQIEMKRSGKGYKVRIESGKELQIAFPLNGNHIYGGPVGDYWPSELNVKTKTPYVTGEGGTGAVAERIWYFSNGVALTVSQNNPLFVSQNSIELRLFSSFSRPYSSFGDNASLEFFYCAKSNIKEAFKCFDPQVRNDVPSNVIQYPIWSTWVYLKRAVNQDAILKFAEQIRNFGFNYSTFEIDDNWEHCYGSQEFDKNKFQNVTAMVQKLKSWNFQVTLWVHPFINVGCTKFDIARPYLRKFSNDSIALTHWWNGFAGLIDFKKDHVVNWYETGLNELLSLGFDGFKFDAGEASYITGLGVDSKVFNPNGFTTNYVNMASSFGTLGEVRVGVNTVGQPIFQRIQDTDSNWLSLKTVITSVLHLGILGYNAIIPDMIGGNVYKDLITKELFIRWVQVNSLLPVMQFSIPPWNFDDETVAITKLYTSLHYAASKFLIEEMTGYAGDNKPPIAPIWWLSPTDEVALTIDSEFLVGSSILVAPVLEDKARQRDIYLPKGLWTDLNHPTIKYHGPQWLYNYSVPLEVLPIFIIKDKTNLFFNF